MDIGTENINQHLDACPAHGTSQQPQPCAGYACEEPDVDSSDITQGMNATCKVCTSRTPRQPGANLPTRLVRNSACLYECLDVSGGKRQRLGIVTQLQGTTHAAPKSEISNTSTVTVRQPTLYTTNDDSTVTRSKTTHRAQPVSTAALKRPML